MVEHNFSVNEEMYLVTIARIAEMAPDVPAPLSRLAEKLAVLPVSANQMVRKLEDEGLVHYTPYKGVTLTEEGECLALQILRRRRLWQVFLVDYLHYDFAQADQLACDLEHALPDSAVDRLAAFLGHPTQSPEGKLIPGCGKDQTQPVGQPLAKWPVGDGGVIYQLNVGETEGEFLHNQGLRIGARINLMARSEGGECLVAIEGYGTIHLAQRLAEEIFIVDQNPSKRGENI